MLLARPGRLPGPSPRGAPLRALGPGMGGRSDQRRVRTPARSATAECRPDRAAGQAVRGPPSRRRPGGAGTLVVDGSAVRGRSSRGPPPARAGGADARAVRDRHPRDGACGGDPGRLRRALRGDVQSRDARYGAPRATSSRGSGALSSPSPAQSSACARCPDALGDYLLLAATDPANPYGAGVPWPKRGESGRGAGAQAEPRART